jgi:amino acid adenylation domain-containing protein
MSDVTIARSSESTPDFSSSRIAKCTINTPAHIPFERSQIEQSIYSRFAEQVAQFPHRPAIWTPRYQWTYDELSARVDAIASALLHRLGDGEGRVALLFDHDAPMIAGMLAAMHAGKAYVPLDPCYPEQRLHLMLQDSSAEAILIEAKHQDLADRLCGGALPIVVEEDARHSPGMKFPSAGPRDMAYILYTSGSTGQPKGVVQNHRNVLHFIRAYTNGLLIAPTDRLTLLSSYSFDAAVMGIFGAILNGACVCPRSVRDGGFGELGAWIREAGISIYHSTPTVFREFLAVSDPREQFNSVRRVVLGGEAVVRRDVELFKRFFEPGAILVNGLGPTESTVTLQHFIDHETKLTSNLVPVGRPVCDTRIVLRDEMGQESDREGEMIFVSEHVALGYWRRPDLNAQSFGEYSDVPGLRWYRSGDLARYREDGSLEFLGRKDSQVKIHGVRIELGDIEAALEQQPGVAEAVVVGRTLSGSELPRLVSYVRRPPEPALDESPHAEQIREGVRALLPSTMVPSIIVFLDAFPKTPTGKIDRLALPEPRQIQSLEERKGLFVPPSNELERKLVNLWQDVLGIEKISVTDDFQSLGGDSLTALRLLFRMKTLGIAHDIARGILQGRTIRQIASPEIENQGADTIRHDARMNLLVNIIRGLLLALVVAGHSLPTLARRLPEFAAWQQSFDAIFNIATPGFAFVFGLTLGKIYYPKYLVNANQTRRMLRAGTWILLASVFLFCVPLILSGESAKTILQWVLHNNPLSYYVMAFATAQIWFGIISRSTSEYIGCAVLMIAFYAVYQALSLWLPYDEIEGPISSWLLIAKFNYFNMSFGVIGGCAAGIYLAKKVDEELSVLSRKFLVLGSACVVLGLLILYLRSGSLQLLGADPKDMGLWRWVLYSGLVLVLGGLLAVAIAQLEKWPVTLRRGAEVIAAVGQCTFPIFVMNIVLWPLKPILNRLDIPDTVGFTLLLVIFVAFSAWCVSSLYRLHYAQSYRGA